MFDRLGLVMGRAAALDSLGMVHHESGQNDRAIAILDESITLCRQAGQVVGLTKALCNLGQVKAMAGAAGRVDRTPHRGTVAGPPGR